VDRIAVATWLARRADRLEAALLGRHLVNGDDPEVALGNGLIRDGHGPRTLETLVRYRGSVLAELFRSLAALKALQAGADAITGARLVTLAGIISTTERTRDMAPRQGLGIFDLGSLTSRDRLVSNAPQLWRRHGFHRATVGPFSGANEATRWPCRPAFGHRPRRHRLARIDSGGACGMTHPFKPGRAGCRPQHSEASFHR
jgi:hypothetical protein